MSRILHVDDSSFSRLQVGKVLKREGHTVVPADNGRSALALLREDQPDLIITDILMPEMDGIALLTALKEQGSTVPVLVATADIQKDTSENCFELGAVAVLNKPVRDHDLLAAVARALGQEG